jgi:hypothetical protein
MISSLDLPLPCNLAEVPLFVTGTSASGDKVLVPIGIHAYATAPLCEPHLVSVGGSKPFWVQSLTAFKKNFFGIEDKLSFERAFYVHDREGKMVHLQNIRFIATLPKQALDMRHHVVFRTPLLSVPAYKCLLKPTQMQANTKTKQRKHLTAQYVSRLLFVYKHEYPDPEECIQMDGVQEECQKIHEGMTHLKQIHADIDAACEDPQTVCELIDPESTDIPHA